MRTLIALAFSLAISATCLADGWLLKAPYEAKTKLSWKVTISASVDGQGMESKMTQSLSIASKTDTRILGKVGWDNIEVNGNPSLNDPPTWDVAFTSNGTIESAGDGPDFVKQLAPTTFIYPDKEIKTGGKWTVKFKPAKDEKEITADYEVMEESKVGETPALRIRGRLTEVGGLQSDGMFWLAKDGKLLKFEVDVKNWTVAGAGMPPLDAKIKGELVR